MDIGDNQYLIWCVSDSSTLSVYVFVSAFTNTAVLLCRLDSFCVIVYASLAVQT